MAGCALQLKETHYYPMCCEVYIQIMRMCTTVQLKGARVPDTKDLIQVRCRDSINVIDNFTYDEIALIIEDLCTK